MFFVLMYLIGFAVALPLGGRFWYQAALKMGLPLYPEDAMMVCVMTFFTALLWPISFVCMLIYLFVMAPMVKASERDGRR